MYYRCFVALVAVISALWAIDVLAFNGRYSQAFWLQAYYQGQQFNYAVKRWLDHASF